LCKASAETWCRDAVRGWVATSATDWMKKFRVEFNQMHLQKGGRSGGLVNINHSFNNGPRSGGTPKGGGTHCIALQIFHLVRVQGAVCTSAKDNAVCKVQPAGCSLPETLCKALRKGCNQGATTVHLQIATTVQHNDNARVRVESDSPRWASFNGSAKGSCAYAWCKGAVCRVHSTNAKDASAETLRRCLVQRPRAETPCPDIVQKPCAKTMYKDRVQSPLAAHAWCSYPPFLQTHAQMFTYFHSVARRRRKKIHKCSELPFRGVPFQQIKH